MKCGICKKVAGADDRYKMLEVVDKTKCRCSIVFMCADCCAKFVTPKRVRNCNAARLMPYKTSKPVATIPLRDMPQW